jgi:hypothetical protein
MNDFARSFDIRLKLSPRENQGRLRLEHKAPGSSRRHVQALIYHVAQLAISALLPEALIFHVEILESGVRV